MDKILFCKPECEFLRESESKQSEIAYRLKKNKEPHFCLKCGRVVHGIHHPHIVAHDNCPIKNELRGPTFEEKFDHALRENTKENK